MDIIYSKCYTGVIMVGGFADVWDAEDSEIGSVVFIPAAARKQ